MKIRECKALARRTLLGRYDTTIGACFLSGLIQLVTWLLVGACIVFTIYNAGLLNAFLPFNTVFSFPKVVIGVMLSLTLFIAACIISLWFEIGSTKLMLNICRGMRYGIGDIFYGFRSEANTITYVLSGFALMLVFFVIDLIQRLLFLASSLILGDHAYLSLLAAAVISVPYLFVSYYVAAMFMFVKIIIADKPDNTVRSAFSRSRELMRGRKLKGFWLMYLSFFFWYLMEFFCFISMLWIIPYISCTMIIFYMEADNTLWQLPDSENALREAGSPDSSSEIKPDGSVSSDSGEAKPDSWEKTVADMHIDIPESFGKTGE